MSLQLSLNVMPGIAVAFRLHAEVILEHLSIILEKLVELFRSPDVESALFLDGAAECRKGVCVLGAVKAALGVPEVPRDVRDDVLSHERECPFVGRCSGKELVKL